MKFTMTQIAAGLVLAAAATGAQAVAVTSLTIAEIGGVAGMSMSSATAGTGAGVFAFVAVEPGNGVTPAGGKTFVSAGTTDGAILANGVAQGNGDFATPFAYGGANMAVFGFYANTANGGVTADWTGVDGAGQLNIDLSGFGGYWTASDKQYALDPDAGTLVSNVQTIAGTTYYTLDWSHVITAEEDIDFVGQRADWHLEGVMAPVPEASTYGMMLAGLGLVGFAVRRRKLLA